MFVSFEIGKSGLGNSHKYIIPSDDLVKVVQFPQVNKHRFSPDFVLGTYQYGHQSIFVIDIRTLFHESTKSEQSITDIYIFKTGKQYIALADLNNVDYLKSASIVENIEYLETKHLLHPHSDLFIKEFYSKRNQQNRYLLCNLSVIYSQVSDDLTKKYASLIFETKEQMRTIQIHSGAEIQPFKGKTNDTAYVQNNSEKPLIVIIQVGKFQVGILKNYISQITPYYGDIESYSFISDHMLGIKRSRNGNIIVFDLGIYFDSDSSEIQKDRVEILINSRVDTPISLVADNVIKYLEINPQDIHRGLFPVTNTENSIYQGIFHDSEQLIPLISIEDLLNNLVQTGAKLLGSDSEYRLPAYIEPAQDIDLDIFSEYLWFGSNFRIGVSIDQVQYVQQIENSDMHSFTNSIFRDIPVMNLSELLSFNYEGSTSVILLNLEDRALFGLMVPDHDIVFTKISKFGTSDHKVISNLLASQSKYIKEYVVQDGTIHFILNLEEIADMIAFGEYKSEIVEGEQKPVKGEYLVYSLVNKIVLIDINEIDTIVKVEEEKGNEIYELEFDEVANSIVFKEYNGKSPLAVRFKSTSKLYSTNSEIEVRNIFEDEFQNSSNYIELDVKDLIEVQYKREE